MHTALISRSQTVLHQAASIKLREEGRACALDDGHTTLKSDGTFRKEAEKLGIPLGDLVISMYPLRKPKPANAMPDEAAAGQNGEPPEPEAEKKKPE